ncbi:MAG TPA: xanthine dehydrogenase family protein subunit M [Jiangellales bacterium]|nr:xanthine dehydrogenase family protein subunit M [Jiangellales bacterium]
MKPSPFAYHRPETLAEALDVLAEAGEHGKVLAGGQSLLPMLAMRLAAPEHLVDVNRLPGLDGVEVGADGVRVGALARHAAVERDRAASTALPLLRQALRHVAHPTIRNRGTTVGSIVHADPSGEMTAVLVLCDGEVVLARREGERTVAAEDFFLGPLESALQPGELATSVLFRRPREGSGSAWHEVSRRHGDYAVCGVGALVSLDADRRVRAARVAYVSMGDVPATVDVLGPVEDRPVDSADWAAAARLAVAGQRPDGDIHASAAYRSHLAEVLTARALADAAGRARPQGAAA